MASQWGPRGETSHLSGAVSQIYDTIPFSNTLVAYTRGLQSSLGGWISDGMGVTGGTRYGEGGLDWQSYR